MLLMRGVITNDAHPKFVARCRHDQCLLGQPPFSATRTRTKRCSSGSVMRNNASESKACKGSRSVRPFETWWSLTRLRLGYGLLRDKENVQFEL